MMLHVVVFSTTFQEFFVLAKLKISFNLVKRFRFQSQNMILRICPKNDQVQSISAFSHTLVQKYQKINFNGQLNEGNCLKALKIPWRNAKYQKLWSIPSWLKPRKTPHTLYLTLPIHTFLILCVFFPANCPAGSYITGDCAIPIVPATCLADKCTLCPKGEYSVNPASEKCEECDTDLTTPGPGSSRKEDCQCNVFFSCGIF